jgi:tRNA uridine 5-carboxymethylaminomethyl modification enzyme
LRADNADQRLTGGGIVAGCVGTTRRQRFEAKMAALDAARALANALAVTPNEAEKHGISLNRDGQRRTAFELLSYPTLGYSDVARIWPQLAGFDPKIAAQLEIDAKYAVYLDRQAADIESYRRDESFELPFNLDYAGMKGLSHEIRQKLQILRPMTIGQAGRIDGVTPAALTLLVAHVRRAGKGRPAA